MQGKRDSLLQLLVKWDMQEAFPQMAVRLATEDITMPDLRRTIRLAELLHQPREAGQTASITDGGKHASPTDNAPRAGGPTAASGRGIRRGSRQRNFMQRIQDEYIRTLENGNGVLPPDAVRKHYTGLTDAEARVAFSELSAAARIVGKSDYPELDAWLDKSCAKAKIVRPRLVVLDSDLPNASALCIPTHLPTVFITTNLLEILSDRQLKAIVGHELRHIKERGKQGLVSCLMTALHDYTTGNEASIREEYRADAFGARLAESADDMVDALVAFQGRMGEIKRFAKQLENLVIEHRVAASALSPVFTELLQFAFAEFRIMKEPTAAECNRQNKLDPHPPDIARFERLYASERANDPSER